MVPSGFSPTKKIVQIRKDFSALLQTEVPTSYLEAPYSNDCKLLEVHLIEEYDLRIVNTGAVPSARPSDISRACPVSQDDIAQFELFKKSYVMKNVGHNANAQSTAEQSTSKQAGCSTVRAFDLTDVDDASFTQCTFQCPAPWCATNFDTKATLGDLLLLVKEPAHARWLSTQENTFRCCFGCRLVLLDRTHNQVECSCTIRIT